MLAWQNNARYSLPMSLNLDLPMILLYSALLVVVLQISFVTWWYLLNFRLNWSSESLNNNRLVESISSKDMGCLALLDTNGLKIAQISATSLPIAPMKFI